MLKALKFVPLLQNSSLNSRLFYVPAYLAFLLGGLYLILYETKLLIGTQLFPLPTLLVAFPNSTDGSLIPPANLAVILGFPLFCHTPHSIYWKTFKLYPESKHFLPTHWIPLICVSIISHLGYWTSLLNDFSSTFLFSYRLFSAQ